MGQVNANILFDGPGPLDKKLVPFQSVEQALQFIPLSHRELGQIVNVIEGNKIVRYCFSTSINVLEKVKDGAITFIQDTPPDTTGLDAGTVWIHSETLVEYKLYVAGTQKVWIELGPSGVGGGSINLGSSVNVDGGSSDTIYLSTQLINGGTA
jgi:hypothetical protein